MTAAEAPHRVPRLGFTLVFNYLSRALVAVLSIAATPVYLRILGPQSYGLIGIWATAQAFMVLLDLGLAPCVARQLSRYRAGAVSAIQAASLLAVAEALLLLAAIAVAAFLALISPWAARHWLGPTALPIGTVTTSLVLTAALLVVRWLGGFYQTALMGLEEQPTANAIAFLGTAGRTGASLGAILLEPSPIAFFAAQLAFAVLETLASRVWLSRRGPGRTIDRRLGLSLLSAELRLALGFAASASIATLINQSDKVVLSHVLPLGAFGTFSLVTTICAGIGALAYPFIQAIQPRLAILAHRDGAAFGALYRRASSALCVVVIAAAGTIAADPRSTMIAWTGSAQVAASVHDILPTYALGTGVYFCLFMPYLLQYAHGNVRLSLIGNAVGVALWIPANIYFAITLGARGTGMVWLAGNLIMAVAWAPFVHRAFLDPTSRRRFGREFAPVALAMTAAGLAAWLIEPESMSRLAAVARLAGVATTLILTGGLADPWLRGILWSRAKRVGGR